MTSLIKTTAPAELLRLLDKHLPRSMSRLGIGKTETKLAQLGKAASPFLDTPRFAEMFLDYLPTKGAKFLLLHGSEKQQAKVIAKLAASGEQVATRFTFFGDTPVSLGGFRLKTIPIAALAANNVTALVARGNTLKSLPDNVGALRSLQALDLSNNQLESLPDRFAELSDLEFLDLAGNRFTEFPKEILALTSLETLDLTAPDVRKRLTAIPSEIAQLTSLKHLTLTGHPIESLPAELFSMPSLKGIVMHGSHRPVLPKITEADRNRLRLAGECFAMFEGVRAALSKAQIHEVLSYVAKPPAWRGSEELSWDRMFDEDSDLSERIPGVSLLDKSVSFAREVGRTHVEEMLKEFSALPEVPRAAVRDAIRSFEPPNLRFCARLSRRLPRDERLSPSRIGDIMEARRNEPIEQCLRQLDISPAYVWDGIDLKR